MMLDQESSDDTALEIESLGNRFKQLRRRLVASLYKVLYFLYQSQSPDLRLENKSTRNYAHCIFMVVYTLQLLSLTLPAYQIEDGYDFQGFFYGISVFRLDFTSIWFEVGDAFYYLMIFLISVPTLSLVYLFLSFFRLKSANQRNYKYLVIFPIKLLQNYGFISCLSILLSVYKYSSSSE